MKSIHRVRVEDRGASHAEQERRCHKCSGTGVCTDDGYSAFPCPFCAAGKRVRVEQNPLSGETTVTPVELHTCWYDDDGNVQCSEDDW